MGTEERLILTEQEAVATAEQELRTSRYIAECTRSPGMRAIHDKRCSWLSVIVGLAKKALNADAVEVVHGRWVRHYDSSWIHKKKWLTGYDCSVCGEFINTMTPYCPYCGAKMDGDGE